jgi:hypothetical protein
LVRERSRVQSPPAAPFSLWNQRHLASPSGMAARCRCVPPAVIRKRSDTSGALLTSATCPARTSRRCRVGKRGDGSAADSFGAWSLWPLYGGRGLPLSILYVSLIEHPMMLIASIDGQLRQSIHDFSLRFGTWARGSHRDFSPPYRRRPTLARQPFRRLLPGGYLRPRRPQPGPDRIRCSKRLGSA